ncbi:MAG: type II toxin-antitoxin system HicA family toxin [Roseiflexus sp.]|nr:type II toxin-antitoxin system HicA family toxin [Roseiflexus sp.]
MGRYPILKPREVVAILENLGFVEVRQRGSHRQYRHPDGRNTGVIIHLCSGACCAVRCGRERVVPVCRGNSTQ